MLVLTRKPAEIIQIGSDIVIKVIKTGRGTVKLGIEAPASVRVMRGELAAEKPSVPVNLPVAASSIRALSDQYPHVA
jgi:carbon storage regulator